MSSTQKKLPVRLLAVSVAIVLVFSFLACMFNTGLFSTRVSRISFNTPNGKLSGLLYMPKGASKDAPRPAVVVTHGYLNSAEMQDANAIELSRRGYVVLALDMYDHGHSDLSDDVYGGKTDFFSLWSPFWINSMYDAAQYMYEQPYVLKDEAGNGIIGLTGHSMGGFSSTVAVAKDEADFAATGIRKIYANLTEGSDFGYSSFVGVSAEAFNAAGGGRFLGYVIFHPYGPDSLELGWVLLPEFWGRGYASALTDLLLRRVRQAGKAAVIECVPEQAATRHLARRKGFSFLGISGGLAVYRLPR